jgi:hypothetical protein
MALLPNYQGYVAGEAFLPSDMLICLLVCPCGRVESIQVLPRLPAPPPGTAT